MTPDFATWLLRIPEYQRTGRILSLRRKSGKQVSMKDLSTMITDIGERANVVVDSESGKFASAHDLRRAFGTRWSRKVSTVRLQQLMRHADIKTTMGYYVEQDADDIAAELWKDFDSGDTSGDTCSKNTENTEVKRV